MKTKQLKKEKEAQRAAAQLAKGIQAANPVSRKAPVKKTKAVVSKAKKTASTMAIASKTLIKQSPAKKSVRKKVVPVVPIKKVIPDIVAENRRGRLIKLLTRFK